MATSLEAARSAFGPFGGRASLNTAHQGPLPAPAAAAAMQAIADKCDPRLMVDEAFTEVPATLRATLARLIGAAAEDIVLTNSTSYGLDLLAHGLPLRAGDEVLVAEATSPPASSLGCHCVAVVYEFAPFPLGVVRWSPTSCARPSPTAPASCARAGCSPAPVLPRTSPRSSRSAARTATSRSS